MERKNVILLSVLVVAGVALLVGVVLLLRARALPGDEGGFLSSPRPRTAGSSATSVAPFIPLEDTPVAPGYTKDANIPVQPVTVFPQPPQTKPTSQTP
jgi:hypothetical protein